jgi:hypothetical protein
MYDRLVFPTPPLNDSAEEKRWTKSGWRPERQASLSRFLEETFPDVCLGIRACRSILTGRPGPEPFD